MKGTPNYEQCYYEGVPSIIGGTTLLFCFFQRWGSSMEGPQCTDSDVKNVSPCPTQRDEQRSNVKQSLCLTSEHVEWTKPAGIQRADWSPLWLCRKIGYPNICWWIIILLWTMAIIGGNFQTYQHIILWIWLLYVFTNNKINQFLDDFPTSHPTINS